MAWIGIAKIILNNNECAQLYLTNFSWLFLNTINIQRDVLFQLPSDRAVEIIAPIGSLSMVWKKSIILQFLFTFVILSISGVFLNCSSTSGRVENAKYWRRRKGTLCSTVLHHFSTLTTQYYTHYIAFKACTQPSNKTLIEQYELL